MASERIIALMLAGPIPDRDEPLPTSNLPATIIGTTVAFLIMSWIAVLFRLYVRLKVVREPGWDDFFVFLTAACNTAATACVIKSIDYGLGRHQLYTPIDQSVKYFMYFYMENSFYITNTALVKISLLFQYLRIFKSGTMHRICLVLITIISVWGLGYSFMAWVPCFPVSSYWNRTNTTKCYGFGFDNVEQFIALFESHTALNMTFDILVFLTPMVLFRQPNLKWKNVVAMTGVFVFGGVVVLTSVWRLYTIVSNRAGTHPYLDFTWFSPISIILSCIEIDLAITCASMPIFWPILEKSLSHIFVTSEVRISTEHRHIEEAGRGYELKGRTGSMKSDSGNSRESLTREPTNVDPYAHYKDQYAVAQGDPFALDNLGPSIETEVASKPKPKWAI